MRGSINRGCKYDQVSPPVEREVPLGYTPRECTWAPYEARGSPVVTCARVQCLGTEEKKYAYVLDIARMAFEASTIPPSLVMRHPFFFFFSKGEQWIILYFQGYFLFFIFFQVFFYHEVWCNLNDVRIYMKSYFSNRERFSSQLTSTWLELNKTHLRLDCILLCYLIFKCHKSVENKIYTFLFIFFKIKSRVSSLFESNIRNLRIKRSVVEAHTVHE